MPNFFHLRPIHSPTYSNLYKYLKQQNWKYIPFNSLAKFSEKNFQFNLSTAEQLEFKHLLAQLVAPFCPQVMPETYWINDQNWPPLLYELIQKYHLHNNQMDNLVWILKPSTLNNGKHIKIFKNLSEVEQHYSSSKRLGGDHVLQQYITKPHLLKGHKYSIRMFVIVTNYAGSYLYPYGYLNVSLHPYQANQFINLNSHLTNEHLKDDESNVVQIPSQRMDEFPALYLQIKTIVATTINALQKKKPQTFIENKKPRLALFGFDFMVDANKRVWLLEANHGPCFPTHEEHPLQKYLYYDFWQAFIASFVLPFTKQKKEGAIHPFETVSQSVD